jgi:hypothetical protein
MLTRPWLVAVIATALLKLSENNLPDTLSVTRAL